MKIRYLFGPKISQEEHVHREVARPLITAGIAESLEAPEADLPVCGESHQDRARRRLGLSAPTAVPAPVWDVVSMNRTTAQDANSAPPELTIQMEIMGALYRWSGDPKNANVRAEFDGGARYLSGFGRPIPEDVLGRYTYIWNKNPTWRGSGFIGN
jgi:hypothetical protein